MGVVVCVIFLADPDSRSITWTGGAGLTLVLLLVVLPFLAALFNLFVLRSLRAKETAS